MGLFFKSKCKECKQVLPKGRKGEFCSDEHQEKWRDSNLTLWQKKLVDGIEKYSSKPSDKM